MLRSILGAVAGYIVTFIAVFVLLTGAYLAIGTDRAFQPGNYQVSMLWLVVSTVLSFIAAVIGGYIASLAGNGFTAVKILAGIMIVLGAIMAAMVVMTPPPADTRAADVPNMEAMMKAQTPLWVALLNPIIGAVGAVVGGRIRKN